MSKCYVKAIMGEHWDDYQLKSVCLGGNAAMFEVCREYGIEKMGLKEKTTHECMKWYRKRHMAMMDDMPFDSLKPPKDMDERLNQAGEVASKTLSSVYNWGMVKSQALKQAATDGQMLNSMQETALKTGDNIGKGAVSVKDQVVGSNHFKRFVGLFKSESQPS